METLLEHIRKQLSFNLPGIDAQLKMGSEFRMKELLFQPENENTKKSSVLILLYPKDNHLFSLLIQRPEYDGTHGGQMALPGGKYEPEDIDISATALRETHEEIGVHPSQIELLGNLTKLFIPPSNYVVMPFIGFSKELPVFKPDIREVAEITEYPVNILTDNSIIKVKEIVLKNNFKITAPYFDIMNKTVWGATAMILSEFKEILKSAKDKNSSHS